MPVPNRSFTILVGMIATIMLGWVLHVSASILQPLVIALLVGSMLAPVVRFLARFKIPPTLTIVALAAALFFGLARVGILIQSNIEAFVGEATAVTQPEVPPAAGDEEAPAGELSEESAAVAGEEPALVEPGTTPPQDEPPGEPEIAEGPSEDQPALDQDTDQLALDGEPSEEQPAAEEDEAQQQPAIFDPLFGDETTAESGGWPEIVKKLTAKLSEGERLPGPLVSAVKTWLEELDLAGLATNVVGSGFDFIRGLFLVVLYMVFIFAESAVFKRKILSVAGDRRQDATQVLDTIARGIQRYLGVKTVASLLTGALCYLALVLLDVPYALLFGVVTVLLNYIPTFGSIIASFFPMATAFALDDHPIQTVIIVAIVYLSVNTLIGSFLEPRVLGRELNLSPLVIIVSVVVWAGLWGVVGAFLAVPLMATLQIVLNSTYTTRPLAVLLSSGPPKEDRRMRVRVRRRRAS